MKTENQPFPMSPIRMSSPSGLTVMVNANGSVRRMDFRDILINLFPGNELEGGPTNIYLRRHAAAVEATPLLGPRVPGVVRVGPDRMTINGEWQGLRFRVALVLAQSAAAWFWHVELENVGNAPTTVDLVYAQDLALTGYGTVRMNEYYVSQYVDHQSLTHRARGAVVASRQNLSVGERHPWTLIGSLAMAAAYATDALQVHGLGTRAGASPSGIASGLPGVRRQHEHSMAVIQDAPLRLEPGARIQRGFFGWFEEHHPEATAPADLAFVDKVLALPEASPPPTSDVEFAMPAAANLFSESRFLDALDLTEQDVEALFGTDLRQTEREDGRLLSFFTGDARHGVLKAKELAVLRPHGHILRTGCSWTPEEASLTTTAWMAGVFNSMLTQGHASLNRFLSTQRSYLGLFRSHGQRIFVELADGLRLLGVPSAFEMAPNECRWFYKHDAGLIEVRTQAGFDRHEVVLSIAVHDGKPLRFLVCNHLAINGDDGIDAAPIDWTRDAEGIFVRPLPDSELGRRFPGGGFRIDPLRGTAVETLGGDEMLFADGRSRGQPFLCLLTRPGAAVGFRILGRLVAEGDGMAERRDRPAAPNAAVRGSPVLRPPAASRAAADVARLGAILPWFAHDALIHYLAPRGLEQFNGGGWGTRDVTQGPFEMMLALGRYDALRDMLIRVFGVQNPNGDWPQWFMIFDRDRHIRAGDSHGDIVFWPLLALAQYLIATEDAALLEETVPFHHPDGDGAAACGTMLEHVERALALIGRRVIPGTHLAAYGHGDWNDAMQPANPALRERLCSAWTVTLHYRTLTALAEAWRRLGHGEGAADFAAWAARVREDFQRLLVVDGTVAGYGHFRKDGHIDYLLHPRDRETGIAYSLLPMIHAIIDDLFTPEQARTHLECIRSHLLGPDGARLFDRPLEYRGGLQRYFRRGESSSFFGREIGLMYSHTHLRYAEALAHLGEAEEFLRALCLINPVGVRQLVPGASLRQANCFYSSSDAAFADRYEAHAEYQRVRRGDVPFDGGWRIYSSGAGIAIRLIFQCCLGLRQEAKRLIVDPVIPKSLDGLEASLELFGRRVEVAYRIGAAGCGPAAVRLNGIDLPLVRLANPYRAGGVEIPLSVVQDALESGANRLVVELD